MLSFFIFLKIGEVLLILLAMLFMVFALLAVPGAILYVIYKNKKNRAAWQEIAPKLNLQLTKSGKMPMTGVYNDCPVKVSIGARRVGYGEDSYVENFTYCEINFPTSLRLLLNIKFGKAGKNTIPLGNANFDKSYAVKAYDANLIRQLLLADFHSAKTQNLMGDLILAKDEFDEVKINDKRVYVETSGVVNDFETIKNLLDATTDLAKRFYEARQNLPPAKWEKQTLSSWQTLANEHNLSLDAKNYILQGNYKNFPVRVSLETIKGKWQTEIKLKFPKSLMTGLKIMPDNSLHKALTWFGMQDIEAGNKAFDNAFIVKAKNVVVAKHKLQPDLCTKLIDLKSRTSNILITDEDLDITHDTVLGEPGKLKNHLDELIFTAQMLMR